MEPTRCSRVERAGRPTPTEGRPPNTRLSYTYRDASNYTQRGEEVFRGAVTDDERRRLAEHMDEDVHFIAEQVGLPNLRDRWPATTDDDHVWHELDPWTDLEPTNDPPTRTETIAEFVKRFTATRWDEEAALKAWQRGDDRR